MGLFRHPHLVRGIVHTSKGGFIVSRGIVDVPDEIGEFFGWRRVQPDDQAEATSQPPATAPAVVRLDPSVSR